MQTILTVVHLFLALGLIGLILIQHGRGADAGAAFGSGASATVFGARGSGSFLSRTTAILATLFFVTSVVMAYYAQRVEPPKGLMDGADQAVQLEVPPVPPTAPPTPPSAVPAIAPGGVPKVEMALDPGAPTKAMQIQVPAPPAVPATPDVPPVQTPAADVPAVLGTAEQVAGQAAQPGPAAGDVPMVPGAGPTPVQAGDVPAVVPEGGGRP